MKRILVVDDDAPMLELLVHVLSREGYAVSAASSAAEAIRIAGEEAEDFDLLVTDIVLKGTERGYEVAWRLTAENPRLSVLLVSGHAAGRDDLAGMVWAPRAAFLEKPFSPEQLREAVRALLA